MTGPAVPAPFCDATPGGAPAKDQVSVGATTRYGKRLVSWTVAQPGSLFGCRFEWACFEVVEREPWRGEPLYLYGAERRTAHGGSMRSSFTERARALASEALVRPLARYGFDRYWTELHQARAARDDGVTEKGYRDDAERIARWWAAKVTLQEMHADGLLTFRPVPRPEVGKRPENRVAKAPGPGEGSWYGSTTATVMASAWALDGQVGWMTDRGELIPLEDVLRPPALT